MIQESIERLADIDIPANPFPGLRPFEFHESYLFFGREGQSESLIDKLTRTRFLAVVGTSGSGKSSLVRAGLLPALIGGMMRQAGSAWRVALMRPGNDPIGNLATALNSRDAFGSEDEENRSLQIAITETTLRRGNLGLVETVRQASMSSSENLIVITDQFEELFRVGQDATQADAENDKAAFVKLLLEASCQRELNIYVVLTMRSDYLGDCAQFWDLPEAINEGQYLIPRLTFEQRRAAITGPTEMGGARITPQLVNRLMNDVGDNPDQLPILQHALMRTWDKWKEENRPEEPVDLRHYEAIGGMSEALSRHADEAYNELPDELRTVAEKTFKALTEKGPDNREIRHQMTLAEICAVVDAQEPEVIAVIDAFRRQGRSFLMPPAGTHLTADTLIDISHESLIRVWERLREWVSEEARSARQYQRLAETAMLRDKGEAGLWRDPDLQLALNWREQNRPNAAWARRYHLGLSSALAGLDASQKQLELEKTFNQVSQFLDDSAKQRTAEIEKQAEQQRLDEERKERELIQAQALAEEQRRRAEGEAKSARRLRRVVGALIVLILLAGAAAVIARMKTEEAEAAKDDQQRALALQMLAEQKTEEAEADKNKAEEAKQETLKQQVALKEANRAAETARGDAEKQAERATFASVLAEQRRREAETARDLVDQQRLIAVEQTRTVRHLLYDSDMAFAQKAFDEHDRARGYELLNSYFPDAGDPDDLRDFDWYYLWRLNHNETAVLKGHLSSVSSVAFSPDGKTLASGSEDKTIKLFFAATDQEVEMQRSH
ncbi:MAG: hypothetical protein V7641_5286 [Blastocatellia bacterium]